MKPKGSQFEAWEGHATEEYSSDPIYEFTTRHEDHPYVALSSIDYHPEREEVHKGNVFPISTSSPIRGQREMFIHHPGHLDNFATDPAYQGEGLGKIALNAAAEKHQDLSGSSYAIPEISTTLSEDSAAIASKYMGKSHGVEWEESKRERDSWAETTLGNAVVPHGRAKVTSSLEEKMEIAGLGKRPEKAPESPEKYHQRNLF